MSFFMKYKKEHRVRFLKRLFLYYGGTLALTGLIARLLSDYTCMTLASFFPAFFAIGMICMAEKTRIRSGLPNFSLAEIDPNFSKKYIASELIVEYLGYLTVPAFFPFIFFFESITKILVIESMALRMIVK